MLTILKIILTLSLTLCTLQSTIARETFRGIDVSAYQGAINFKELASSGCNYLYIRAGEGGNTVDSRFEENYQGAKSESLHYGFYYYVTAKNTSEAESQAEHFASLIAEIPYTLRPAMDFEEFSDITIAESNEIALTFLKTLEELTSVTPVLYSDADNVKTRWSSELSPYPLWVADYAHLAEPENYVLPENDVWTEWSGYQYTDSATITGIQGNVDGDLFTSGLMIEKNSETTSTETTGNETFFTYTVKKGNTLWGISKTFQTTVDILAETNDIANENLLYVGEILKIPMKQSYTVESGDTLTKIALKFDTTVDVLAEVNEIQHINLIYVGEILYIP